MQAEKGFIEVSRALLENAIDASIRGLRSLLAVSEDFRHANLDSYLEQFQEESVREDPDFADGDGPITIANFLKVQQNITFKSIHDKTGMGLGRLNRVLVRGEMWNTTEFNQIAQGLGVAPRVLLGAEYTGPFPIDYSKERFPPRFGK